MLTSVPPKQPPDALVPHLKATLAMGWEDPPELIQSSLKEELVTFNSYNQDRSISSIECRCGNRAFQKIKKISKSGRSLTFENMRDIQQHVTSVEEAVFS